MVSTEEYAQTTISSESSDEELVESLREGDEKAWSYILQRYSGLISSAAHNYARTTRSSEAYESHEDTASALYLLMIERVRDSILKYYRGECQLKTWIYRLIGDRRQIIKAFLMQTDTGRHRADTRLPRLIQKRPELDQEVYRRLVWGKDSSWIAWDLGLSEIEALQLSRDIMDLLKKESPRVHRRIMANRRALQPSISLDRSIRNDDGDEIQFEASDTRPLPDANFEQVDLLERLPSVEQMIREELAATEECDLRLLFLVFDQGWSLAEVVEQSETLALGGITARHQVDYRITRVLRQIATKLCEHIGDTSEIDVSDSREEVVAALKELFRDRGITSFVNNTDAEINSTNCVTTE